MTAPAIAPAGAPGALAEIAAQVAAVQARIAALTAPATPARQSGAAAASAQSFAAQYATATAAAPQGSAAVAASGGSGGSGGSAIVADASRYLGIPYVWGGESTSGMDCSGLVQKTFADLGVSLPRTAAEQSQVGTPIPSLADAQPGDLLFFGSPAYHVAIYAGNNQLIESPEPGKTVHRTDVYQTPTSIRRISVAGDATGGGLDAAALRAAGIGDAVARFATQFAGAEAAYRLPTGLLAAVAQQESGGNTNALSPVGAQGLMQLMPSTAAGLGVNAYDPAQAITAAAQILSRNLAHYNGSVPLALAAYNAGMGAVDRYGGIPPYAETQGYVRNITAMLAAGG